MIVYFIGTLLFTYYQKITRRKGRFTIGRSRFHNFRNQPAVKFLKTHCVTPLSSFHKVTRAGHVSICQVSFYFAGKLQLILYIQITVYIL